MRDSGNLIALKDYARLHCVQRAGLRRALKRGAFKTAVKLGRHWFFDAAEPYPEEPGVRSYSRFTLTDRLALEKMLSVKTPVKHIAEALGKTQSAVYREIKRGTRDQLSSDLIPYRKYCADAAEADYRERVQLCGGQLKIGNDIAYSKRLEALIAKHKFSPAAALAQAKREGFKTQISVNTIYNYIARGVFLNLTQEQLPCAGRRKRQYGKIKRGKRHPAGVSIEKRPSKVNSRSEFGHWEMDTVHGKAETKGTLLVLTERLSRYELIFKLPNNKTAEVVAVLDKLKRQYGNLFCFVFKSITVDNGSEFADSEGLQRTVSEYLYSYTKVYYCHSYSSWERGSNENANKLIRRWIPKGTPIENYTHKQVADVQDWMNAYPRKILGWRTAQEVFNEHIAAIIYAPEYHIRV
jgi:IS30 family transposase